MTVLTTAAVCGLLQLYGMCLTPTLLTGDPGECISIEVIVSCPVYYVEVVLLQLLQPPRKLSLRVFEVPQPG